MDCPQCDLPLTIPRAAFFGPGERIAECPSGHQFLIVSQITAEPTDEADQGATA